MKTKEERIYEWALRVYSVEMVKEINKTFGGLALTNEEDMKTVISAVNRLLSKITKIDDLADTGLGIHYWHPDGSRREETKND